MVRRVGVLVSFVVVAVGAILVARPGPASAEPTPTPVPTVASGRICVQPREINFVALDSCDGVRDNPVVLPTEYLSFRIVSPIYEDLWIRITVSRVDGTTAKVLKSFDIQAIPNAYGVWNQIGTVASLDPALTPGTTHYRISADANGRHIGDADLTVTWNGALAS